MGRGDDDDRGRCLRRSLRRGRRDLRDLSTALSRRPLRRARRARTAAHSRLGLCGGERPGDARPGRALRPGRRHRRQCRAARRAPAAPADRTARRSGRGERSCRRLGRPDHGRSGAPLVRRRPLRRRGPPRARAGRLARGLVLRHPGRRGSGDRRGGPALLSRDRRCLLAARTAAGGRGLSLLGAAAAGDPGAALRHGRRLDALRARRLPAKLVGDGRVPEGYGRRSGRRADRRPGAALGRGLGRRRVRWELALRLFRGAA